MPAHQRALLRPLRQPLPFGVPAVRSAPAASQPARGTPGARWIWVVAVSCSLASAGRLRAQTAYVRFDIVSVEDTTFNFATTGSGWVKPSRTGIVVDPLHGDELIAKFRVTRAHKGTATGIVTGQTARLSLTDVALLTQPHPLFLTRPWFWIGVVAGGVIGYVAHGH